MKKSLLVIEGIESLALIASIIWLVSQKSLEPLVSFLACLAALVVTVTSNLSIAKYTKLNVRILFIDDEDMPVTENLRQSGWLVEKINDVSDVDSVEIQRNNIIFVDYKGVGRNISPKYEGIAVIKKIKDMYGNKKRVILYSAHPKFSGNLVLDSMFGAFDNKIRKNADTFEFENMILGEMKKIR